LFDGAQASRRIHDPFCSDLGSDARRHVLTSARSERRLMPMLNQ
jgi:hypothetical protein